MSCGGSSAGLGIHLCNNFILRGVQCSTGFMLARMKGEQMATQAPQRSLYSNMPTIPNSSAPKKPSGTSTIITLVAAALGFTLVAAGLAQYVSGEGSAPMNMGFDFLNKVGWDIPVTPPIEVMLIGVVLLLVPIVLALKYDGTSALWGLLFMVGAGGMAWVARETPAQLTNVISTPPWGNDASLALVFVLPLLAVGAYLVGVRPLVNSYRKVRDYQRMEERILRVV
jgi:hypothetical protein